MEPKTKLLNFVKLKELAADCGDIIQAIKDDVMSLAAAKVIANKGDGQFVEVQPQIYMYKHPHHAACSSVTLSMLESMVTPTVKCSDNAECGIHRYHDDFMPYFFENDHILTKARGSWSDEDYVTYLKSLAEDTDVSNQKHAEFMQLLMDVLAGKVSKEETPFECPILPSSGWTDNDWTKRLLKGVQCSFPTVEFKFTATLGTQFPKFLSILGAEELRKEAFLFRGAPDIVIHRDASVITTDYSGTTNEEIEDTTLSSEDEVIENSHQRSQLTPSAVTCLPEKTGELIAGLHMLLVSKIYRTIRNEKPIERKFTVKGVLLDKVCATVHCALSAQVKFNEVVHLKIELRDYGGEMLSPQILCTHIATLTNWSQQSASTP